MGGKKKKAAPERSDQLGSGDTATRTTETPLDAATAGGDGVPDYLRSTVPEPGPPCFEVLRDKARGRYVVATRFIPAGSVICAEEPVLICPNPPEQADGTTCLGCCIVLNLADAKECPGCNGPLCSPACETSPFHVQECDAMQNCGARFSGKRLPQHTYAMLPFLRLLLLEGEKATRCRALEAHAERCQRDPNVLRQMHSLAPSLLPPIKKFSLEERCWAFGVMETNCFSFSERYPPREAVVLLDLISLPGHSCVRNAFGTCYSRPDGAVGVEAMLGLRKVLVAASDIQASEEITVSYTHPHLATQGRQNELASKNFRCTCKRCEDPGELGLHTNTQCCATCQERGVMSLPAADRLGRCAKWRCAGCKSWVSTSEAVGNEMNLYMLDKEINAFRKAGDAVGLEKLLRDLMHPRGRLHPTHELVLDAKYFLVTMMYGHLPGLEINVLKPEQLQCLKQHSRDYLKAIAIAEPGYGLRMGRVNLALNSAHLEVIKRCARLPPTKLTMADMDEAEECLQRAEVAFRCSADMRPALQSQREETENARRMVGWLQVVAP